MLRAQHAFGFRNEAGAVENAGQRIVAAGEFRAQFDIAAIRDIANQADEGRAVFGRIFADADMDGEDLAGFLAAQRVAAESEDLGALGGEVIPHVRVMAGAERLWHQRLDVLAVQFAGRVAEDRGAGVAGIHDDAWPSMVSTPSFMVASRVRSVSASSVLSACRGAGCSPCAAAAPAPVPVRRARQA